jgi:hydroxypyruvate reductase 2
MAIAKRAEAFSCRIPYFAQLEKTGVPYKFYGTILELANNSDMLVLTCALTKETTHIVDRKVLDALGPEVSLVAISHMKSGCALHSKGILPRICLRLHEQLW